MEGIVVNFRGSRRTKSDNQMVVYFKEISKKQDAEKLIDKNVVWTSPAGKEIKGIISKAHGNSGAVRVMFEKGMPGQAIGDKVKVI